MKHGNDTFEQTYNGQTAVDAANQIVVAADLTLFATAIRFDAAYHGAFLLLDILWRDRPKLKAHKQRMLNLPGVADSVAFEDYRVHYFDDAAFNVRRAGPDGHFIVPRTFGETIVIRTSETFVRDEGRIAS